MGTPTSTGKAMSKSKTTTVLKSNEADSLDATFLNPDLQKKIAAAKDALSEETARGEQINSATKRTELSNSKEDETVESEEETFDAATALLAGLDPTDLSTEELQNVRHQVEIWKRRNATLKKLYEQLQVRGITSNKVKVLQQEIGLLEQSEQEFRESLGAPAYRARKVHIMCAPEIEYEPASEETKEMDSDDEESDDEESVTERGETVDLPEDFLSSPEKVQYQWEGTTYEVNFQSQENAADTFTRHAPRSAIKGEEDKSSDDASSLPNSSVESKLFSNLGEQLRLQLQAEVSQKIKSVEETMTEHRLEQFRIEEEARASVAANAAANKAAHEAAAAANQAMFAEITKALQKTSETLSDKIESLGEMVKRNQKDTDGTIADLTDDNIAVDVKLSNVTKSLDNISKQYAVSKDQYQHLTKLLEKMNEEQASTTSPEQKIRPKFEEESQTSKPIPGVQRGYMPGEEGRNNRAFVDGPLIPQQRFTCSSSGNDFRTRQEPWPSQSTGYFRTENDIAHSVYVIGSKVADGSKVVVLQETDSSDEEMLTVDHADLYELVDEEEEEQRQEEAQPSEKYACMKQGYLKLDKMRQRLDDVKLEGDGPTQMRQFYQSVRSTLTGGHAQTVEVIPDYFKLLKEKLLMNMNLREYLMPPKSFYWYDEAAEYCDQISHTLYDFITNGKSIHMKNCPNTAITVTMSDTTDGLELLTEILRENEASAFTNNEGTTIEDKVSTFTIAPGSSISDAIISIATLEREVKDSGVRQLPNTLALRVMSQMRKFPYAMTYLNGFYRDLLNSHRSAPSESFTTTVAKKIRQEFKDGGAIMGTRLQPEGGQKRPPADQHSRGNRYGGGNKFTPRVNAILDHLDPNADVEELYMKLMEEGVALPSDEEQPAVNAIDGVKKEGASESAGPCEVCHGTLLPAHTSAVKCPIFWENHSTAMVRRAAQLKAKEPFMKQLTANKLKQIEAAKNAPRPPVPPFPPGAGKANAKLDTPRLSAIASDAKVKFDDETKGDVGSSTKEVKANAYQLTGTEQKAIYDFENALQDAIGTSTETSEPLSYEPIVASMGAKSKSEVLLEFGQEPATLVPIGQEAYEALDPSNYDMYAAPALAEDVKSSKAVNS